MKKGFLAILLVAAGPLMAARAEVAPEVLQAQAERVEVIKKASAATVAIFAGGGDNGGSGVVISPDGYALSNFHVTQECGNSMKVGMADGKLYDAVIVGIDPTGDVALIKLLGRGDFPCAPLGDSDTARAGDWVYVIGNPFLLATDFRPTVTYGVLSGTHRYQYPAGTILEYTDCLQSDAAINPGNSGGPMFNSAGELIGINGRGSFEKRGRVNVGVGYAISINQIKNFLGMLKSGRIVDHATLGASVASDENNRAVVSDILPDSDAARRGLSYDDQILTLGTRSIRTVNDLKNVLGILPKEWRVPLEFVHEGQNRRVLVRLQGVHRENELADMIKAQAQGKEGPPGPPIPKLPGAPELSDKPVMPEIARQVFEARDGFANYFFNKQGLERVWQKFISRGDFSEFGGAWTLVGELAPGGNVTIKLDDKQAIYRVGLDEALVELDDKMLGNLQPPGSGGLLGALGLWRRLLVEGPQGFGNLQYLGTAPFYESGLPPVGGKPAPIEAEVLVGTQWDAECLFYFSPIDGSLLGLEMFPVDDSDPCEIYFSDYRPEQVGLHIPRKIEVRHGDSLFGVFQWSSVQLKAMTPRPVVEKTP